MSTLNKFSVTLKTDAGKQKINIWSLSKDEAIKKVLNTENAPIESVLKCEIVKPTIYDIKRRTSETGSYFFSSKTMKFFKQKLSDFKVIRISEDSFEIYAHHEHGRTERIFNPYTNKLIIK